MQLQINIRLFTDAAVVLMCRAFLAECEAESSNGEINELRASMFMVAANELDRRKIKTADLREAFKKTNAGRKSKHQR